MDEQQNAEEPEAEAPATDQGAAEGQDQAEAGSGPSAESPPPPAGEAPPRTGGRAAPPPLPPELQSANATKDEQSMAMIAHLLGLVGFLGPLILYLVKKDEVGPYVKFHIKQSMWFQIWANVACFGLGIISIPLVYVCIGILTLLVAFLIGLGAWIYAIVGAVQVSGGKDFEYLWVGPWVRRSVM